ncbi:hypothetical protein, partial [Methylovulum psychrotolerans]|uniref:hypothetical protein n=1 Tax=Methylovulum psychrotolerans TaxID=1704499 RepID=UPI0011AFD5F3
MLSPIIIGSIFSFISLYIDNNSKSIEMFFRLTLTISIELYLLIWVIHKHNKEGWILGIGKIKNYRKPSEIRREKISNAANHITFLWKEIINEKEIHREELKREKQKEIAQKKQSSAQAMFDEQAGWQKLFQYIKDIRNAIDLIEEGEDNRVPKQMI